MILYKSVLLQSATIWLLMGTMVQLEGCFALLTGKTKRKEISKPSPSTGKFGCAFQNENYFVNTKSIYHPVYGVDVEPMYFGSTDEFANVQSKISEEYSQGLKEFVLNTVPLYYDFYEAFKKHFHPKIFLDPEEHWLKRFFRFFKNYIPKFSNQQDSGMAIELLNRLIKHFPAMSKSVHLVTCSKVVEEDLLFDLNIENFEANKPTRPIYSYSEEPPLISFEHSHVAALFRIRIKDRLGYVLMDLVTGHDQYVVMMEDGRYPHTEDTFEYKKLRWDYYLPRHDYVVARSKPPINSSEAPRTLLYYIGKPYCSFLMTTTKPALMNSHPSILRRNEKGSLRSSIDFDITGENPSNYDFAFSDHLEVWRKSIFMKDQQIMFKNQNTTQYQKEEAHLDKVLLNMDFAGLDESLAKAEELNNGSVPVFTKYMKDLKAFAFKVRMARKQMAEVKLEMENW